MKLINCFSYVQGHKEAQQIVNDLNRMKSSDSKEFYIDDGVPDDEADYTWLRKYSNSYLIRGSVTQSDWDSLDLSSDFMTT
jgi:hypothetical protein